LSYFDSDAVLGHFHGEVEQLRSVARTFEESRQATADLLAWAAADKGQRGTHARLRSLEARVKILCALHGVSVVALLVVLFRIR
jgi:hypothetical protein